MTEVLGILGIAFAGLVGVLILWTIWDSIGGEKIEKKPNTQRYEVGQEVSVKGIEGQIIDMKESYDYTIKRSDYSYDVMFPTGAVHTYTEPTLMEYEGRDWYQEYWREQDEMAD